MNNITPLENFDVLIEFSGEDGLELASSLGKNLTQLREESNKAMNIAMGVIHAMAHKVSKAIDAIEDEVRPDEMEVEFSIKLDLEGGAIIPIVAKTSAGGQFNIKFKWAIQKLNRPTVLVSENR